MEIPKKLWLIPVTTSAAPKRIMSSATILRTRLRLSGTGSGDLDLLLICRHAPVHLCSLWRLTPELSRAAKRLRLEGIVRQQQPVRYPRVALPKDCHQIPRERSKPRTKGCRNNA